MKKITSYILCLFAGSLALTSCNLDAPAKSSMTEDVIFSTEALADAAVMAIHESFGQTNSYRGRYITYYGMNTDAEVWRAYGDYDNPANDRDASLSVYAAQPDNSYMNTSNNVWNYMYEAIERANKAIESMQTYADLENSENMRQLYGELLTLRGYIYFDLVKTWGDVPYRFEPNTSDNIYLPRTDRTVILQKVLEDLLLAEDYVGWPNENQYTTSVERVSKTFTKGLRARIALFMAGQSYYPNEGMRYNLTDESSRQEMYQIAYDECVSIINQGCNTLASSFETIWKNLCQEDLTAGNESIYEMPFASGRGRVVYSWGTRHSNNSDTPPSATYDQWTQLISGGRGAASQTLWYDYDPEDARRNVTVVPYIWQNTASGTTGTNSAGNTFTYATKVISGGSGGGWTFGKLRFEWMTRLVTSTNDDGINWLIMRYADIYMMAAEAANELGNISAAQQYLQPILSRALPSNKVSEILNASTSHDTFFKTIVEQRKLEFAGEQLRKTDLIRWGLLKTKLDETSAKMQALANRTSITTDYGTFDYSQYAKKIYYEEGLGADYMDADGYEIYGLEKASYYGLADGTAVDSYGASNYSDSTTWFAYRTVSGGNEDDDTSTDTSTNVTTFNNSIDNYINNLYVNDPDANMFWPIWQVFINGSNNQLTNDGYINY